MADLTSHETTGFGVWGWGRRIHGVGIIAVRTAPTVNETSGGRFLVSAVLLGRDNRRRI